MTFLHSDHQYLLKLSPHPLFDNFGPDPGKEAAAAKLGVDINTSYILFFGFIRAYKGLDLYLKAFASPGQEKDGNVKLIVRRRVL
jgi:D-inositol-3-phosphate glycosyltransferase